MTIVKNYTKHNDENFIADCFILSSDAKVVNGKEIGDPTEVAFINYGIKTGRLKDDLDSKYERVDEFAFDSNRKLMSTLTKFEDKYRVITKGAIDNILKISTRILDNGEIRPITEKKIKKIYLINLLKNIDDALKVMGVAYKIVDNKISQEDMESDLIMVVYLE